MIQRRKPLAHSLKRIERSKKRLVRRRIEHTRTRRAQKKIDQCNDAKAYFFRNYNIGTLATEKGEIHFALCQICGETLASNETDACHKFRRWKGLHEIWHFLAGHRRCHTWMDSRKDRQEREQLSTVNCATGGVVDWSPEQKASLERWLKEGIDPIELGRKS